MVSGLGVSDQLFHFYIDIQKLITQHICGVPDAVGPIQ